MFTKFKPYYIRKEGSQIIKIRLNQLYGMTFQRYYDNI